MGFRVLEIIDTRPVRRHREQMLLYCHEILAQGYSEELEDEGIRQMWQFQMLKEGASRHVIKAMEDFPKDPTIHSTCMHALCAVAIRNKDAQLSLLELGALSSVLISGLGFVSNPDVTAVATATLSCLSDENSDAKNTVVRMGGPQFAVDSRDRHPDKPNVLCGVAALVAGMCINNPDTKMKTLELDYVQKGLQGIRDFPNSEDKVRQKVMQAFQALSGTPPLQEAHDKMMQGGVLEGVLTVLHESDDMITLTNANMVVQNLAMIDKTYRAVMTEFGVVELLAGQLGTFVASKAGALFIDVDLTAVQALSELSKGDGSEDDISRRMLKAGVMEKVQDAMNKRPGHIDFAVVGWTLMNRLESVEKQS